MEKTERKIKVIVINHGHLDIEWYKTLDAYRFWAADIIDTLCEEAAHKNNYEAYTFDGSVFLLDDLIRYFPHYKERIRQLIRMGKLRIGPFYTQFDEWIPSAECMVRNCLWGNRKSLEYGTRPMRVGYLPDNFGHPRQLPQILRNFGIDSLLFTRGMVDIDEGREFHFIGADDSELIAVNYNYATHFLSENNDPEDHNPRCIPYFDETNVSYERHTAISVHKDIDKLARQMIEAVENTIDLYSRNVMILPMGSDHCPPQVALGDTVARANELQDKIEFVFAAPEKYKEGWVVPPTEFLPFNEWIALNDGENGMAIAFKGLCTYKVRYEGEGTILSVPVNRSIGAMSKSFMVRRGAAPSDRYGIPDAQCIRKTEIEWSYIPYQCDAHDPTPFMDEAESFLYPPGGLCQYKGRAAGPFKQSCMTPFTVKGDVRVSLFDRTYDGGYYLLRLYENNGKTAEAEIHLENCHEAYLANMNEEILDSLTAAEGRIGITVEPYKVVTILWR